MYDMKLWFLNPNWKTSHLEGTNTSNGQSSKVIQHGYDTGKTLVFTKTNNGFPWDVKEYDNAYIYDTATELDWTSPKDYKANGWPMCPRIWDGDPSWYYYQASAPWKGFQNCKQVSSGDVGPVLYSLQGPYLQDFGGDIGVQETILLTYLWGGGKNREQLFLTQAFGWVQWTHANAFSTPAGIIYQIDSVSLHNKVVQGSIAPQFPCFAIP